MPSSRRSDSGIEPKSLFRLLHWQAGSLPLASLGKPTVLFWLKQNSFLLFLLQTAHYFHWQLEWDICRDPNESESREPSLGSDESSLPDYLRI